MHVYSNMLPAIVISITHLNQQYHIVLLPASFPSQISHRQFISTKFNVQQQVTLFASQTSFALNTQ